MCEAYQRSAAESGQIELAGTVLFRDVDDLPTRFPLGRTWRP